MPVVEAFRRYIIFTMKTLCKIFAKIMPDNRPLRLFLQKGVWRVSSSCGHVKGRHDDVKGVSLPRSGIATTKDSIINISLFHVQPCKISQENSPGKR